jgi:hypothetical protein
MRPDNIAPLIAAAHQRHELTRAKAIKALRELDYAGTPVTFEGSPAPPGSPIPGSTTSRTCEPRSNASATPLDGHHRQPYPPASGPQTPHCCGD